MTDFIVVHNITEITSNITKYDCHSILCVWPNWEQNMIFFGLGAFTIIVCGLIISCCIFCIQWCVEIKKEQALKELEKKLIHQYQRNQRNQQNQRNQRNQKNQQNQRNQQNIPELIDLFDPENDNIQNKKQQNNINII